VPLRPVLEHSWDLTPKAAAALQRRLAEKVSEEGGTRDVRTFAALDVAFPRKRTRAVACLFSWPDLERIETAVAEEEIRFPYVPGLLSFREAPALLSALARLEGTPDLLLVDGQGVAHPRRLGIASHLGVILDVAAIGCAKSVLCGAAEAEPAQEAGSWVRLLGKDGSVIGALVRTRARVRPVVVSVGHRITLERAVEFVLACRGRFRLPEPLRTADRISKSDRPAP